MPDVRRGVQVSGGIRGTRFYGMMSCTTILPDTQVGVFRLY